MSHIAQGTDSDAHGFVLVIEVGVVGIVGGVDDVHGDDYGDDEVEVVVLREVLWAKLGQCPLHSVNFSREISTFHVLTLLRSPYQRFMRSPSTGVWQHSMSR